MWYIIKMAIYTFLVWFAVYGFITWRDKRNKRNED